MRTILERRRPNPFLAVFEPFQARIAELGIYNSLAQLLIKITAPGVPDFYQGNELWDLSLVDPDNRRPVDYEKRRAALSDVASATAASLLDSRADGRVKMFVAHRALAARAAWRETYEQGDYRAVANGGRAPRLRRSRSPALVGAPRRVARGPVPTAAPRPSPSPACRAWSDR